MHLLKEGDYISIMIEMHRLKDEWGKNASNWFTEVMGKLSAYTFALFIDEENKRLVIHAGERYRFEWDCEQQMPISMFINPEGLKGPSLLMQKFGEIQFSTKLEDRHKRELYQQRAMRLITEAERPFINVYSIRNIANYLDRSPENEAGICYEEELHRVLEIDDFSWRDGWNEQTNLKGYWIQKWYCTDEWVGSAIYYLDNEPAFYVCKTGRRSGATVEFFTREIALKVREFLLLFIGPQEDNIPILGENDCEYSHYNVDYESEILEKDALLDGTIPVHIKGWEQGTRPNDAILKTTNVRFPDGSEERVEVHRLFFRVKVHENIPTQPRVYVPTTEQKAQENE